MALTQILTTDSVSASVVNTKIVDPANTAISGLQIAQTAGGTATAITLTGVELTNGYQKTFIINASNSGAATTVNGKPLYKPGGTVAPNLVAGKAASIWYNLAGDCFFYKASAEGTATAGDVLAGVTFSNDNDTGISGTLALTGDSLHGDVVIGKTFYNTDAKTKLTGTGTNAKRVASGSAVSSSAFFQGSLVSSGVLVSPGFYKLSVTGIEFSPTMIYAWWEFSNVVHSALFLSSEKTGNVDRFYINEAYTNDFSSVNGWVRRDDSNFYAEFGAFSLPIPNAQSKTINWVAYE